MVDIDILIDELYNNFSYADGSGKQKANPTPDESKIYEKINEILKNILKFLDEDTPTDLSFLIKKLK